MNIYEETRLTYNCAHLRLTKKSQCQCLSFVVFVVYWSIVMVLGQKKVVLVSTWWYWVSMGRYWLFLGDTGLVLGATILVGT